MIGDMNTPDFDYSDLDYIDVTKAMKGKDEENSQYWQIVFKVNDVDKLSEKLRNLVGLGS